jgi:hypothetical protein
MEGLCLAQEDEHEAFASLASLAACEGAIRRDCAWRSGPAHCPKFRKSAEREGHI